MYLKKNPERLEIFLSIEVVVLDLLFRAKGQIKIQKFRIKLGIKKYQEIISEFQTIL